MESRLDPGGGLAALTVRLLHAHAGLPAGTLVLVAVVGSPSASAVAASARPGRHRKRVVDRPLHVTPPLAVAHEVFPVFGKDASYGDTYGGFRSDVAGRWHHGDDIVAPLGTPVVAVADGTISRLGWNKIGGWRRWLRDDGGGQFYYAHLSGYTASSVTPAMHSRLRRIFISRFIRARFSISITTAPSIRPATSNTGRG